MKQTTLMGVPFDMGAPTLLSACFRLATLLVESGLTKQEAVSILYLTNVFDNWKQFVFWFGEYRPMLILAYRCLPDAIQIIKQHAQNEVFEPVP